MYAKICQAVHYTLVRFFLFAQLHTLLRGVTQSGAPGLFFSSSAPAPGLLQDAGRRSGGAGLDAMDLGGVRQWAGPRLPPAGSSLVSLSLSLFWLPVVLSRCCLCACSARSGDLVTMPRRLVLQVVDGLASPAGAHALLSWFVSSGEFGRQGGSQIGRAHV